MVDRVETSKLAHNGEACGLTSSIIIRQLSQITQIQSKKGGSPAFAVGVGVGRVARFPPLPAVPTEGRRGGGVEGRTAPLPPPPQFCCCSLSRNLTWRAYRALLPPPDTVSDAVSSDADAASSGFQPLPVA